MNIFNQLKFFTKIEKEQESNKYIKTTHEEKKWEEAYRQRWRYDKVIRSTHGVNCTGSCSWKIYVKNGLVTYETQQTDYPKTRPDLPDHEPRGCPRGASYSWYLYSAHRVKYPLIRSQLLKLWIDAKKDHNDPVKAWESIIEDKEKSFSYKKIRGLGGMVRLSWDEANEIIAASNVYTIKRYGPDRIIGFSPIPAMSMVSYTAGSRYLSLIGGVCMSFYDWYCDLPVASPQTWGEQTDVPESADWYNSGYIICWGSNVPLTRTPDAHFLTEVRYKGTKTVGITPDYSEVARLTDHWLKVKQGTDAALAMAMVHVVLSLYFSKESSEDSSYFKNYIRQFTDMPYLIILEKNGEHYTPGRFLRASDFINNLNEENNPDWKAIVFDQKQKFSAPKGSIGFRWGEKGKWSIEEKTAQGEELNPFLTLSDAIHQDKCETTVSFPYFAGQNLGENFPGVELPNVFKRNVPTIKIKTESKDLRVATVYDLMLANYSIDFPSSDGKKITLQEEFYREDIPYNPIWASKICGLAPDEIIKIAKEFSKNAEMTQGRSMVIIGASVNHWYHSDMAYRSIISLLMLCGTLGVSGGGWAHYVGQEKLRPQTGWLPLAFALDWNRPPRQQNTTSFWYLHTDQWRYEKLNVNEMLSPLAKGNILGHENEQIVDCNVKAERMGWLPSAPQLNKNPLHICQEAKNKKIDAKEFLIQSIEDGSIKFASQDPDHPSNFPRNLFVWRSNLLGSSAKGHEYFLRHILGTENEGVRGEEFNFKNNKNKNLKEVIFREEAPKGKLDLLVTLDFRMSTTCIHSDIVLPTATWYEKNDLNTSDMHPFIHPLTMAVNPAWEAKSDWEIFKGIAKKFSFLCQNHLHEEEDIVLTPILHDTPFEIAQPFEVKDWKKKECDLIPGKTMPNITILKRNYPETYNRMITIGPLLSKLGNGGKGLNWDTKTEIEKLKKKNGTIDDFVKIENDTDVAESILTLAPETNGHVSVKAWRSLENITGRKHDHLAIPREHEQITFNDIVAQPKKIISSPIWSGIESDSVCYTANYTNVNEKIPWRTLTGRQQFYQDHPWMREYGEQFGIYKPPVDVQGLGQKALPNGNKEIILNILTPHQKWGIHSTYTDNLLMLTLGRGGPVVWVSEHDAQIAEIKDNDWIEVYNVNGSLTARAVVSQRIPKGVVFMYHAQEKNINTPLSETTHTRGIHNSISRIVLKPTHMIGGYAHQSYGFNYIGTIGTNRDEFIFLRKMNKVDWI